MAASKPMPPMTTKRCSPITATSRRRRSPWRATSTAPSRSLGMSKLAASRLPVPPGSTASGTSVPARPVTHAITVPSPPWAMTRSAPSATAWRVTPWPGSCRVVSSHSTSSPALASACSVSRRRLALSPPPVAGLNTTAIRVPLAMADDRSASPAEDAGPGLLAQRPVQDAEADAADDGQQPDGAQQHPAEHVARVVHAPVHAGGGHDHRDHHGEGEEQPPDQRRACPFGGEHGDRPVQRDRRRRVPKGKAQDKKRLPNARPATARGPPAG